MKRRIRQVVIGEVVRCWTTGLLRSLQRKCMYSVIQFLGGKCQEHPEGAKTYFDVSSLHTIPVSQALWKLS